MFYLFIVQKVVGILCEVLVVYRLQNNLSKDLVPYSITSF